jgi:nucleotide-binding universal stress UspA family protein
LLYSGPTSNESKMEEARDESWRSARSARWIARDVGGAAMKARRILHPSDFSRASAAAFRQAIAMAKADRAELLLAHVVVFPTQIVGDGYLSPMVYDDLTRSMRAEGQKQLDKLVTKARTRGVRARSLLLEGVPADAINRAARAKRADVIVLGTHGRTGLARLFMGSVAERVVGGAPCPVLTVRGK